MVCIRCMTYNQENYIEDAMNGFTMQHTSFPYIAVIVDDASTDGNTDVIQSYLKRYFDLDDKATAYVKNHEYGVEYFAQHKLNRNCFFVVLFLKENYYSQKKDKTPHILKWLDSSKYHSFCEGDDYWIYRNKLQRQVDYLESHPDCNLVFHNALLRFQDQDAPDRVMRDFQTGEYSTAQLFRKWQLPLASVVCKREIQDSKERQKLATVFPGGFTFFIASSMTGKVYGISECWSIYRKNMGGVSNAFSSAYCLKIDLGFAHATGDVQTIQTMETIATERILRKMSLDYKRDKDVVEMINVADSFNKKIFQKVRWKYFMSLPKRFIRKISHFILK